MSDQPAPPAGHRWITTEECHQGTTYCARCAPQSPHRPTVPLGPEPETRWRTWLWYALIALVVLAVLEIADWLTAQLGYPEDGWANVGISLGVAGVLAAVRLSWHALRK